MAALIAFATTFTVGHAFAFIVFGWVGVGALAGIQCLALMALCIWLPSLVKEG